MSGEISLNFSDPRNVVSKNESRKTKRRGSSGDMTSPKARRVTQLQQEMLLQFMQENPDFATRRASNPFSRAFYDHKWEELAVTLNNGSGGEGSQKSVAEWRKTWSDWRKNVRLKASGAKDGDSKSVENGGGARKLSDVERRLLELVGTGMPRKPPASNPVVVCPTPIRASPATYGYALPRSIAHSVSLSLSHPVTQSESLPVPPNPVSLAVAHSLAQPVSHTVPLSLFHSMAHNATQTLPPSVARSVSLAVPQAVSYTVTKSVPQSMSHPVTNTEARLLPASVSMVPTSTTTTSISSPSTAQYSVANPSIPTADYAVEDDIEILDEVDSEEEVTAPDSEANSKDDRPSQKVEFPQRKCPPSPESHPVINGGETGCTQRFNSRLTSRCTAATNDAVDLEYRQIALKERRLELEERRLKLDERRAQCEEWRAMMDRERHQIDMEMKQVLLKHMLNAQQTF